MFGNMGRLDRLTRVVFGGVICAMGWASGHWEMAIPGGLAIVTGLIGFCPFYGIFRFDTLDSPPVTATVPTRRAA